jgi:hypothetical protein
MRQLTTQDIINFSSFEIILKYKYLLIFLVVSLKLHEAARDWTNCHNKEIHFALRLIIIELSRQMLGHTARVVEKGRGRTS